MWARLSWSVGAQGAVAENFLGQLKTIPRQSIGYTNTDSTGLFAQQSFKSCFVFRVAVISAKNHKRQRRKRQSVTAKQEKSQTQKVLTAILTLPNLT